MGSRDCDRNGAPTIHIWPWYWHRGGWTCPNLKTLFWFLLSQLPLDIDESTQDLEVLRKATEGDKTQPACPQTTMTCYIHLLRLRIIDTEIQHNIYRVDSPNSPRTIYKTTDRFLERLFAWKNSIPPQSIEWDPANRNDFRGDEYQSYDSYVRINDFCWAMIP